MLAWPNMTAELTDGAQALCAEHITIKETGACSSKVKQQRILERCTFELCYSNLLVL